jgi:DNA-binding LacI/PurR family transcriptional regulator
MSEMQSGPNRARSVDVARLAGVSQAAVSRAFRPGGSISAKTLQKVMNAAARLNYVPNSMARSLSTRQSNTVALLIGDLHNPFYAAALDTFSVELQKLDKQILLFNAPHACDLDGAILRMLEYQVDGIIITPATVSSRMTALCLDRGIPVVMFNRFVPGLNVSSVSCDNIAGGVLAAQTLVQSGGSRFALITGGADTTTNRDRVNGFERGLLAAGVDIRGLLTRSGDYTYSGGYRAAKALLAAAPRPDALFCTNDIMALGALDAARDLNIATPDDLAVVGFDDIPETARSAYRLTTLRQPLGLMVREALKLLVADEGRPTARVVKARLVRRRTTRPQGEPNG